MKKIIHVILYILGVLMLSTASFLFIIREDILESKMISLVGLDIEEARRFATKNVLEIDIKEAYDEKVEKGHVISQNIKKGAKIEKNDKLELVISKGPFDKTIYAKYKVNELGRIPIMMYHGIHNLKNSDTAYTGGNVDSEGYQRTVEAFRNDLEMYYQKGYRMIRLDDYMKGKIDVALGYSPIVLTFDDGLKNNIRVTGLDDNGEIIIDPDSAVGVLEAFKKKYPDFGVTATFFLNSGLFEQEEYNEKIMKWLVQNGYDIGNHTSTHADLTRTTLVETTEEVGSVYALLNKIIPKQYVNIVALPFGSPYQEDHPNYKAVLKGTYNGMTYETEAALQVGWMPDYSPYLKTFNPHFLMRIRAYDNNGEDFDIDYNFKLLETVRYISDGDINTIVIPESMKEEVGETYNRTLVTYGNETKE